MEQDVQDYFKNNPGEKEVFTTSDGTLFKYRMYAFAHSITLEVKDILAHAATNLKVEKEVPTDQSPSGKAFAAQEAVDKLANENAAADLAESVKAEANKEAADQATVDKANADQAAADQAVVDKEAVAQKAK